MAELNNPKIKEHGKIPAENKTKILPIQDRVNKKKPFPGVLEENIVYSCAGPRVDPDQA